MHNKIYQISSEPIVADDYISECDFCDHWFTNEIADWVNSEIDRNSEIEWLGKQFLKKKVALMQDEDSFILLPNAKGSYFGSRYNEFAKVLDELRQITPEEYLTKHGAISNALSKLRDSFSEKFGDYVSSEEFETITFDEFMRIAEIGKRYYIGGVVDYHW